jgi:uncharacterized protein
MSIALLDVNVLIALFDPSHPQHEPAHQWFGRNRKRGLATSSINHQWLRSNPLQSGVPQRGSNGG